jgi:hypothetical protein
MDLNVPIKPDLLSQFNIDEVLRTSSEITEKINSDFLPYLFEYYVRPTIFGEAAIPSTVELYRCYYRIYDDRRYRTMSRADIRILR